MATHSPALTDILSLIQQHAHIQLSGRPTRHFKNGTEYHSNCPFCNAGKDRFAMWPDVGRYYCRVCGKFGDAIQFLREYENMTYQQACQELDIDPRYPEEHKPVILPLFMTSNEAPNQKWMDAAEAFVHRAQRYLWTPGGERALNYLHSRGFTDETLKLARIGFCPDWYSERLEDWGLLSIQTQSEEEIKIPEGIIIPWTVDNKIWKISVRRPDKTYFQVLGSSDCLYNIDALQLQNSAFLFEGEFDALSAMQEAGHLAAMIATGSASKGRTSPLVARLKKASHVLVAFDTDGAGHAGAAEWLSILKNSMRWRPWAHDANQMLQDKKPIRLWAEMGLKAATTELQAPETLKTQQPAIAPPAVVTPSKSAPAPSYGYPTKPTFLCRFCKIGKWTWYRGDQEYICIKCYSPATWTQKSW